MTADDVFGQFRQQLRIQRRVPLDSAGSITVAAKRMPCPSPTAESLYCRLKPVLAMLPGIK
ncbi:MAG: hypothetical protein AB7G35_13105, partial [Hyphomicrobiaceae bacterium]